jgi:hypothetical protein
MHTQYIYASDESVAIEKVRHLVAAESNNHSEVGHYSVFRVRRTFWERIANSDPKWKIDYVLEETSHRHPTENLSSTELVSADVNSDATTAISSFDHAPSTPEQANGLDCQNSHLDVELHDSPEADVVDVPISNEDSIVSESEPISNEPGVTVISRNEQADAMEMAPGLGGAETRPAIDDNNNLALHANDSETVESFAETAILDSDQTSVDEMDESTVLAVPLQVTEEIAQREPAQVIDQNDSLHPESKQDVEKSDLPAKSELSTHEQTPNEEASETNGPPEANGIPELERQSQQLHFEYQRIYDALQLTLHVDMSQKLPTPFQTFTSPQNDFSTSIKQHNNSIEKTLLNRNAENSIEKIAGLADQTDLIDTVFKNFDSIASESNPLKPD